MSQVVAVAGQAAGSAERARVVSAVAYSGREPLPAELPGRILIAPFGEVQTAHGVFVVDGEGMAATIAAFAAHGTDLPIDFEHQSLGGSYSAPNGLAPAAGWIKRLEAVLPTEGAAEGKSADARPGLWADVEWTPLAVEQLRTRQYRYLSPVALVRREDRRMIGLHSAALTNTPAINHMRPVIARGATAFSVAAAGSLLAARAADGSAVDAPSAVVPVVVEPSVGVPIAVERGNTAAQATASAAAASAGVDRLRLALSLAAESDAEAVLSVAADRLLALGELVRAREATDLVELASAAGKLGPLQRDWAHALALRDPVAFSDWYQHAPQIVPLGRISPPEGGGERSTAAAQRRARGEYRRNVSFLGKLCGEEAYVADALRGQ